MELKRMLERTSRSYRYTPTRVEIRGKTIGACLFGGMVALWFLYLLIRAWLGA